MPDSPTRRSLWPLSGAVYALLFGAGSAATLIDSPTFGGPSADALRYFTEHDTLIYAANIVSVLSVPFLLWFAAAIHTALDGPDHTSRIFAKAAAAGATAAAAATAVEVMILTVGVIRLRESNDLTAEQASVLYDISTAIGGVAIPCCLAATHAAVGFAILTNRLPFSRLFAVLTLVVAAASTIIPLSINLLFATLALLAIESAKLARLARPIP